MKKKGFDFVSRLLNEVEKKERKKRNENREKRELYFHIMFVELREHMTESMQNDKEFLKALS